MPCNAALGDKAFAYTDVHLTMAIDTVFVSYTSSLHMIASHTSINPPSSQLHCIVSTKGDRELTSRLGELRAKQQHIQLDTSGLEKKRSCSKTTRFIREDEVLESVHLQHSSTDLQKQRDGLTYRFFPDFKDQPRWP